MDDDVLGVAGLHDDRYRGRERADGRGSRRNRHRPEVEHLPGDEIAAADRATAHRARGAQPVAQTSASTIAASLTTPTTGHATIPAVVPHPSRFRRSRNTITFEDESTRAR